MMLKYAVVYHAFTKSQLPWLIVHSFLSSDRVRSALDRSLLMKANI